MMTKHSNKIKELIANMTVEEKAAMMSGKDFWQTKDFAQHGIPSIFLADGPHGIRKQAKAADHLGLNPSLKSTCFPTAATLANSWDTDLAETVGTALGAEAVHQQVNVLLGPGINIKRNPKCGRNFEYYSEDPYLAGRMSAAYIGGIQSQGVAACVKHFAANNQEDRRMVIDAIIDERALREIYLTAFEMAITDGGAKTVMTSYNRLNGDYANENKHLLQDILRGEWGFGGVAVTDWGGCNDRVKGLECGNELEMPTTGGDTDRDIVDAVKGGRIDESLLDENLERLLELIFTVSEKAESEYEFDEEKHRRIAQNAAENSIVLLKNRDNILPLASGAKVAVIGDFARISRYQGAGSSVVNPTKLDNALDVIGTCGLNYTGYESGFKRYGKKSKRLIKKAVKLADKSDVVLLYIGLDENSETEGLDRQHIRLPQNQLKLIEALGHTGKKIVAVLSGGSVVETDWADDVDALVFAGLGGQAVPAAVINVITGKANPCGKLSETYPVKYEDCPSAAHFPGGDTTVEYRESIYVGYRYYDTADVSVRFPFGYGLSYTTFEYSDLTVTDDGVEFALTNTGNVAGAEIAQLYIGACGSAVFRPKKELKGFVKVYLKAGESKKVHIPFDKYSFRYFNVKTDRWEIEPCDYDIMIGASVADIRLTGNVVKTGSQAVMPYAAQDIPSYCSGKVSAVTADEFCKLYGKKLPDSRYVFVKKNRIEVDVNTTVQMLKYSKGWTGRAFAGVLKFADKFLRLIGKASTANMLNIGVFNMPVRGISRMTGGKISWGQLKGLLLMFNGKFFKGFSKFVKEGRIKKKMRKNQK